MKRERINVQFLLAILISTATILPAVAHELTAQAALVRIPARPDCQDCKLSVDTVAIIGGSRDGDKLYGGTWLARDSRGQFYGVGYGPKVLVFDPKGSLVREFGTRGQGPGEFASVITRIFVTKGDTLYVLDSANRLHIFSPSLAFVRTTKLPGQSLFVAVRNDSRILFGGLIRQPQHIGFPFHMLAADGAVIRSMGTELQVRPGAQPAGDVSILRQSDSQNDFWHWMPNSSRFEQWSVEGRKLREVEVVDIPGWRGGSANPAGNLSTDAIQALRTDRSANDDSARAGVALASPSRLILLRADFDQLLWLYLFSSPTPVLQIIDPLKQKLLISAPFPNSLTFVEGTDLMFSKRQSPDGFVTITVLRLQLKRGSHN